MVLLSEGEMGATLRRLARNQERLTAAVERIAAGMIPGATVTNISLFETTDVRQPAKVRFEFKSSTFAHVKQGQLSVPLVSDWQLDNRFDLEKRRYPLLLGIFKLQRWNVSFELPQGSKIKQPFQTRTVKSKCLVMKRTVQAAGTGVKVEQKFETKCERIGPKAYAAHRKAAHQMEQMLRDEMVVQVR